MAYRYFKSEEYLKNPLFSRDIEHKILQCLLPIQKKHDFLIIDRISAFWAWKYHGLRIREKMNNINIDQEAECEQGCLVKHIWNGTLKQFNTPMKFEYYAENKTVCVCRHHTSNNMYRTVIS